jgi:hypothetical protein
MSMNSIQPAKRKRGRPCRAAAWLDAVQLSEVLRCEPDMIERLLDRAPGAIPGAVREAGGWQVPERGLRVLLSAPCGPLPQMVTVADVAASLRISDKSVYRWLKMTRADGLPLLPSRRVLGSVLIEAKDVLALPARLPGPPSSFFAMREAVA